MKHLIKEIAKRIPGLDRVAKDLNILRLENMELKSKNSMLANELTELSGSKKRAIYEAKPKIYIPSSADLKVTSFPLDHIPARKK